MAWLADAVTYRPWSMAELDEVEPNGMKVASLFSGCGGSSLGYRLAGYRVVYANEFVPLAAESYRANASPETIVDERDIRTIDGGELRDRFGDLDVLDGSPPCAAFSSAGRRHHHWGEVRKYSSTEQRVDDLFDEYVRIVRQARPRSFVAENVAGFGRSVAVGYALRTLASLREAGYRVEARIVDAQWLGVPQQRRRTIILGVRNDLDRDPVYPKPQTDRAALVDAVPGCRGQMDKGGSDWRDDCPRRRSPRLPSLTIGTTPTFPSGKYPSSVIFAEPRPDPETGYCTPIAESLKRWYPNDALRYFALDELRSVCSFPVDFKLHGTYRQRWERLGRAVPPLMMREIARTHATVIG
jgi:DNA (cytosine-5)-methyltransferase 1